MGPFTPWDGPVRDDGVLPFRLIQSKLSFLACFQLHRSVPKAHVSTAVNGSCKHQSYLSDLHPITLDQFLIDVVRSGKIDSISFPCIMFFV